MTFTFYSHIIPDADEAEVISGETSIELNCTDYLVVQNAEERRTFKIVYEHHCGPFREATIVDHLLLVGLEGQFYIYDMTARKNILLLKMEWYFGHIYFDEAFV